MPIKMRLASCAALISALTLSSGASLADLPEYHVLDLGTIVEGEFPWSTHGRAMNASGQVTGYFEQELTLRARAFFWDGTDMHHLGHMLSEFSIGTAINDSGWVAGTDLRESLEVDFHFFASAFLWDGVNMIEHIWDRNTNEWSGAADINASGQVLGNVTVYAEDAGGSEPGRAFIWNGTTTQFIPPGADHGDVRTVGISIADDGTVVGWQFERVAPGQLIGPTGFVWDGTTLQELSPRPPLRTTYPLGDLNERISADLPEQPILRSIEDINEAGQILATGIRAAEPTITRTYVLTPIPLLIDRLREKLTGAGPGQSFFRNVEVLSRHYAAGRLPPTCAQLSSLTRRPLAPHLVAELMSDIADLRVAIGCR